MTKKRKRRKVSKSRAVRVPEEILISFRNQSELADGEITPERCSYFRRFELLDFVYQLVLGMFDRTHRWDQVEVRYGAVRGYLDRARLYEGLGKVAELRCGDATHFLILPHPQDMIREFEDHRLECFERLRARLGTSERFMAYFRADPARSPISPLADTNAAQEEFPTLLTLANLLLMYWRRTHHADPLPPQGWYRGRFNENQRFRNRVPSRELWSEPVCELFDRLEVEVIDYGGFGLPGSGGNGTLDTGDGRGRRSSPRRYDPSRLLFYMSLDPYVEPRSLEGANPNHYEVVSFGEKCIVDSPWTNNRVFGLDGPLDQVIRIAIRRKDEISSHPLCSFDTIHDTHGTWRNKVRNWLGF